MSNYVGVVITCGHITESSIQPIGGVSKKCEGMPYQHSKIAL